MKRLTVLLLLLIGFGRAAATCQEHQSNYDCFYVKAAHVARVRGVVLDPQGKPVSGAKIELLRQGAEDALANTQSGEEGEFRFSAPGGRYWVHVEMAGFHPAGLNVDVASKWFSLFNWKRLYVVMTAGSGAQPCPPEIGSKKELDQYVRNHGAAK